MTVTTTEAGAVDIERKGIKPIIKSLTDSGEVEAVFATMNVIDKDGDVTLPGAFGEQTVAIVWGHDWQAPVGRGTITEKGNEAILTGQFFMETQAGSEAYKTVKAMGDLQEWSYGFRIAPGGSERGSHEGSDVQFLKPKDDGSPGLIVHEVSPVLVGAGEGTRTLAVKQGKRLADQLTDAQAVVTAAVERFSEVVTLRETDGKKVSDESRRHAEALAADMREAADRLEQHLVEAPADTEVKDEVPEPEPSVASAAVWRDFIAAEARAAMRDAGVTLP